MLTLILGNLHVPYRAVDLPAKFKQLLHSNQGKIDKIFICSTEDDPIMKATSSSSFLLDFLEKEVCSNIELVNSDTRTLKPKHALQEPFSPNHRQNPLNAKGINVYQINGFKVAILSQYTVVPKDDVLTLINLSRQSKSDILVWAGNHEVEAYSLEGVLFLSPGTATGAFDIDGFKVIEESPGLESAASLRNEAIPEEENEENEESGGKDVETVFVGDKEGVNVDGNKANANDFSLDDDKEEGKEGVNEDGNEGVAVEDVSKSHDPVSDTEGTGSNSQSGQQTPPEPLPDSEPVAKKDIHDDKNNSLVSGEQHEREPASGKNETSENVPDKQQISENADSACEQSIENIPAFILLDIPEKEVEGEDNVCKVYIYSLLGAAQELKIDKVTFVKN